MDIFYNNLAKLRNNFCENCHELWPSSYAKCTTCGKNKNKFNKQNKMVPDIDNLPIDIKKHIENITMIEEMLISPILAVMSICRLPGGQLISKGYVANFAQDIMPICKALPRLSNSLPVLIIKKSDQNNNNKEFKVNKERVSCLLKFFCKNNPDWIQKGMFKMHKQLQKLKKYFPN